VKLIVGIGNPGRRYATSRHNLGWVVVDALADRYGLGRARRRFEGWLREGRIDGVAVALLKPTTYVNESGRSVALVANWYHLAMEEVLVCCDDVHLPLGRLRVRRSGSSGGHGGLASIIERLATDGFARLRVGIGPPGRTPRGDPGPETDQVRHVLGRFRRSEWPTVEAAVERAADAVVTWARQGIDACMNAFN